MLVQHPVERNEEIVSEISDTEFLDWELSTVFIKVNNYHRLITT